MTKNVILTRPASSASDRRNQLLSSCLIASLLALPALPAFAQTPGAASQTQAKTFIDYFLPTPPHGELSRDAWGAANVLPRDPKNGLEDTTIKQYCYWDGQIIKAPDGKYHMFASRWPESRGHGGWVGSVAVHAVSDSLMGPYIDQGLCWPNDAGGRGHNVGALTMADGRYAVYVSETRPTEVYVSKSLDGPWEHLGTVTVEGNPRWHGSNVSLMVRPDGKFEFTERSGSIYTSDKGILGPYQRQSGSVYPRGIPNLEDPCIWYSGGLYHILVNSWSTRKAYHLTSADGIHDWTNRGVAYDPRESIVRYPNGTVNHWNKVERPAVYLENGHVVAVTLAAIDVEKEQDRGGDGHGSKVIVIPFDGAALDRDLQSQPSVSGSGAAAPPILYSSMQVIGKDDTSAAIAEKAAKVLPRPNQTAWMRMERTFFLHYGPNAFHNVEWGNGRENPSLFNPTAFDAEQWMRAIQDANGKMIVLVCKHHDGLCLWQTRYTDHSVAGSPWRGGKGDEVREVAEAAKKYDIKLGVYLSPADLYQLRTNPTNPRPYYGNRSPTLHSTIPTDPASFTTDPSKGRTPPQGFQSYSYEVDDYNRYFLNQLYELLTDYGPVHEVWFDGANPDRSVPETYDYAAWYDLIHKLRPDAIIACKGPDVRWVGNEGGVGRTSEWSVIPLPKPPETFIWPDQGQPDLGSRSKLLPGSYLWWYPAEVNQPILYGWFWGPGKGVRTSADLVNTYYQSVGRNGVWLLNLSPDTRGLIPDNQLASLSLSSQVIRDTFVKNLAVGGALTADSSNPAYPPSLALDGNLDTWWEAAPGKTTAELVLKLPAPVTFDVVSMQEAVDHRGQRIESFSFDTWDGSKWVAAQPILLNNRPEEWTTVGFKRLLRLRSPATTDRVRIRISQSRLEPALAEIGLFKQAEIVQGPVISERDTAGAVTLSNPKNLNMVYTTDGSAPTKESALYRSPIPLRGGGTVNAACVDANGRLGMTASKRFWGNVPTGWKVIAVDNREPAEADNAARAIDGDSSTMWQSSDSPLPHSLTIDMGSLQRIGGLCYIPPRGGARGGARGSRGGGGGGSGTSSGAIDAYRFETSEDGKNWTANVNEGRFGNIRNNPIPQEVRFAPVTARFFRFTAVSEASGNNRVSVAEITVLPAAAEDVKR